ncbi:hypothetical protein SNE40_020756 [Patella caerulea]|uniref:Chorein N-terminal domain-containing protein n=1 Tax=Patella caerulea TaxID=87958 RepID=A0AAN8P3N1_PATCE
MLEGLAAWILNTYVGEYVENLNTDQLSIALLQGDVELENLPLKKSALKSLDIPLEVRSGVIGKIVLHIPIRGLRSEPWSISIENLYLVAGPLTNLQYDEKTEKENEEIAKQVMLDALEAKWKILRQDKQEWATSSWFSYGTSMATNILENIQLNVKNVHFRYEDDKLNPESPFACGVIISHLSAQSTNQDGKPVYVQDHGDVMYKLVDLNNCSVYCDVDTKLIGSLSQTEFIVAMQADMLNYTREKDPHDYILQPISAKAQVKRYTSALPLRSSSTPRITVNFTMEAIDFQLGQDQFKCFGLWNREFDRHNRRRKYRKNRPINTVTERPSKWWKFAINCHLSRIHEERQRNTWDFILERSRILVDYYDTYMSHLTEGIINQYNENRKLEIEKELDFEELKIIRELVLSRLQTENKLSTFQSHSLPKSNSSNEKHENIPGNQPGLFQRWFPGWGGWSQTSIATENMTPSQSEISLKSIDQSESDLFDVQSAVSTEIEREIMDVIQDSTENSSFLRKDTVFAKMKFTLSKGSFQLLESAKSESGKDFL